MGVITPSMAIRLITSTESHNNPCGEDVTLGRESE